MGTWVIEANLNGTKYPTSFKVEEYGKENNTRKNMAMN